MMKFLEVRNFRIKCEITANRKDNGLTIVELRYRCFLDGGFQSYFNRQKRCFKKTL